MTIAVKRRHLTIRRWLLTLGAEARVLNIGCGTIPVPGLSRATRIINLDVERKPFVDFVLYDGSVFPFRSNSFDAALCLGVLVNVADDDFMLREAARVLRPRGALILTNPALEHDFREITLALGKRARRWSQVEAYWGQVRSGYEVGELVCKCHAAGLKVVAVEEYGGTIAQALYQLWYLRDLAWLFSKKLVLPWLLMELALRLDHLFYRNRGCAIAVKAVRP